MTYMPNKWRWLNGYGLDRVSDDIEVFDHNLEFIQCVMLIVDC